MILKKLKKEKYIDNLPDVTDIDNPSEFEKSQTRTYNNYVYPILYIANGDNVFENFCNSAFGNGGILPHYLIYNKDDDKKKVNLRESILKNDKLKKRGGGGAASLVRSLLEVFGIGPNGSGMAD